MKAASSCGCGFLTSRNPGYEVVTTGTAKNRRPGDCQSAGSTITEHDEEHNEHATQHGLQPTAAGEIMSRGG